MPQQGNEEQFNPTPGKLEQHTNHAFSESHSSAIFFRSVSNPSEASCLEESLSDGEDYIRTRSHSAGFISGDSDSDHIWNERRSLTPQTHQPTGGKSYAHGAGKFSQRCINRGLAARDIGRINDSGGISDSRTNLRDDGLDIKKEKEPDEVPPFSLSSFSRKKKFLALSLGITDFAAMFCLSVMAPFYPKEASDRGISDTVSGWVFGVFALVQFLTSPVFGKVLPKVGAWFLFQAGLFLAAGCTVLFGFLSYMPNEDGGTMFIMYSFILRIFMAFGCTSVATAGFAIIGYEFGDYASVMFGIMETFSGVGLMVGPAIGGFLFAAMGFPLPFIVIGGVMFFILFLNWILLPDGIGGCNFDVESIPVSKLLRIPSISLVCFSLVISASVWSILDPILEPHLREFNLGSEVLGLIFLLMSASYAISSPAWGWLSEKTPDSKIVILLGFFGCGFAMFLLAPSPILGFARGENILSLNIVSLLALGITTSMAVIPTFESVLDSAELAGLEDNMGTYATVAGLWGSMYALGDFVGPVLGGLLNDSVGFQWSTTYMGVACLVTGFILLVLYLYEVKFGRIGAVNADNKTEQSLSKEETEPLLTGNGAVQICPSYVVEI